MSHRPHTILLIDDDAHHLKIESWAIAQAGFRAINVVVGSDSLGLPENEQPELIFLDYRLNSALTSAQVAGLLRQTFRDVPIILLSGHPEMPREMAALVDGFLNKADPKELVRFARNYFRNKQIAG
jgi:CheY-like chemotaxis protein